MPVVSGKEAEIEAVLKTAEFMALSARTAPKAGGEDDIVVALVYGEEKEKIAREMEKIAEERNISGFKRDGKNVADSDVVVLVGVRGTKSFGLNCGACGYSNCEEFQKAAKKLGRDFTGPNCMFKLLDLGIALGSAVKTAGILNVDNRIMYRIGVAAKRLNLLPEATVIMGIPLSSTGKNIYFDRK